MSTQPESPAKTAVTAVAKQPGSPKVSAPAVYATAPSAADCLQAVVSRYQAKQWSVVTPRLGPNSLVANINKNGRSKYHFVHLGPPKLLGEFVQNAFSNGATPVIATATVVKGAQGYKITTTFVDANTKSRIII